MAPHIFVETNWLFAYAAPAHHQVPAAAELLDRARRGEFTVHMPNICLGEARQAFSRSVNRGTKQTRYDDSSHGAYPPGT